MANVSKFHLHHSVSSLGGSYDSQVALHSQSPETKQLLSQTAKNICPFDNINLKSSSHTKKKAAISPQAILNTQFVLMLELKDD